MESVNKNGRGALYFLAMFFFLAGCFSEKQPQEEPSANQRALESCSLTFTTTAPMPWFLGSNIESPWGYRAGGSSGVSISGVPTGREFVVNVEYAGRSQWAAIYCGINQWLTVNGVVLDLTDANSDRGRNFYLTLNSDCSFRLRGNSDICSGAPPRPGTSSPSPDAGVDTGTPDAGASPEADTSRSEDTGVSGPDIGAEMPTFSDCSLTFTTTAPMPWFLGSNIESPWGYRAGGSSGVSISGVPTGREFVVNVEYAGRSQWAAIYCGINQWLTVNGVVLDLTDANSDRGRNFYLTLNSDCSFRLRGNSDICSGAPPRPGTSSPSPDAGVDTGTPDAGASPEAGTDSWSPDVDASSEATVEIAIISTELPPIPDEVLTVGAGYSDPAVFANKHRALGGLGDPLTAVFLWRDAYVQIYAGIPGRLDENALILAPGSSEPVYLGGAAWTKFKAMHNDLLVENSPLGLPQLTEQVRTATWTGTRYVFALFQINGRSSGNIIHHTSGSRAGQTFEIHGPVFTAWADLGYDRAETGLPISDTEVAISSSSHTWSSSFERCNIAISYALSSGTKETNICGRRTTTTFSVGEFLEEGGLYEVDGGTDIYLFEAGTKRCVPDPETFVALGYNWDRLRVVSASYLGAVPGGRANTSVAGSLEAATVEIATAGGGGGGGGSSSSSRAYRFTQGMSKGLLQSVIDDLTMMAIGSAFSPANLPRFLTNVGRQVYQHQVAFTWDNLLSTLNLQWLNEMPEFVPGSTVEEKAGYYTGVVLYIGLSVASPTPGEYTVSATQVVRLARGSKLTAALRNFRELTESLRGAVLGRLGVAAEERTLQNEVGAVRGWLREIGVVNVPQAARTSEMLAGRESEWFYRFIYHYDEHGNDVCRILLGRVCANAEEYARMAREILQGRHPLTSETLEVKRFMHWYEGMSEAQLGHVVQVTDASTGTRKWLFIPTSQDGTRIMDFYDTLCRGVPCTNIDDFLRVKTEGTSPTFQYLLRLDGF